MTSPGETLRQIWADADNGTLGELCERLGVDLVVVFGSARTRPKLLVTWT